MSGSGHKINSFLREKFESLNKRAAPSPPPPPVNLATKPRAQGSPSQASSYAYWELSSDPSRPVSEDWKHEVGANGWGNNELQNYTTSSANSRHARVNGRDCLVLSAVAERGTFTSARLMSKVCLDRERGYLSARITAPSASMSLAYRS
jgi:hypothetical protein